MIPVCFEETGIVVVLNCFGKKNFVYASIAGMIREPGFYDIALRTPSPMIINLKILFGCYRK